MATLLIRPGRFLCLLWLAAAGSAGGCCTLAPSHPAGAVAADAAPVTAVAPVYPDMPRELTKVSLPPYRIEPPDILVIDVLRVSPRPPYFLQTGDAVEIQVRGAAPEYPIAGPYVLGPGGVVDLGFPYGAIPLAGLTLEQARHAITGRLRQDLREPIVSISLLEMGASQQIAGEHLVALDGTVTLGVYGQVYVAGLTVAEAKRAIEWRLAQFLEAPEVAVDVFAYNSKVYYVITEGAGLGDRVVKFPVTGNETVLDAIANINGLEQISSKRIWIARPTPCEGETQILPVDWVAVSKMGVTTTNYQLMPGDRVFIAEDNLVAFDSKLAKTLTPIERIFGFTLLGTSTVTRLSGKVLRGGGDTRAVITSGF